MEKRRRGRRRERARGSGRKRRRGREHGDFVERVGKPLRIIRIFVGWKRREKERDKEECGGFSV